MNGSPLVLHETRQHILEIVKELGYTPNLVARQLSLGKTLAIGIIVPYFTRPSVSERLSGAVSMLSGSPYDLVIHNIESPEQRASALRNTLRRERVDGVLIFSLPIHDDEVELLSTANLPIVLIDTHHPALHALYSITVDDIGGGMLATQHLIQLGHTRIGFVGDHINNPLGFMSSRNRHIGYARALSAAGIPVRPEFYAEDEHGRRQAREQARRMLSNTPRPSAIVAASDTQAIGVLEAARELGLRVPEDLSVVGYDDIEVADILALTTIRQGLFDSGCLAVQLLLDVFANPGIGPVQRILPTELIVRRTSAPPG
jgi:DNA-binding LacI/PurR family transcriptional regulator